jgi:hypothetical protein
MNNTTVKRFFGMESGQSEPHVLGVVVVFNYV